jgi:hypothetical protein
MLDIKSDFKFVIITDDVDYGHEYFPDYPIMCNSVTVDFTLLNKAKYLIIANSTFSWWAAWLNLDNYVIAPQGWLNVNIDKWKPSPYDIQTDKFIWI